MFETAQILRARSRPLARQPTDATPNLAGFVKPQAALFDVYGTMFVSASGDVGVSVEIAQARAAAEALAASGLVLASGDGDATMAIGQKVGQRLLSEVHRRHAESRDLGVEAPEVDIADVWRIVLHDLAADGVLPPVAADLDPWRVAVEYETRVNPVWPMPGLESCLEALRSHGCRLGIVSNAQFFTLELFPALLNRTLDDLGFDRDLIFCSHRHGRAKPSLYLYDRAAAALANDGILPREVLYIGNDMLNDIWPARRVGFRTALFAGDRRSLRWRADDERVTGLAPDWILTDWEQLAEKMREED